MSLAPALQRVVQRRVHQLDDRAGVFADGLQRQLLEPRRGRRPRAPSRSATAVHRAHGFARGVPGRRTRRRDAPGASATARGMRSSAQGRRLASNGSPIRQHQLAAAVAQQHAVAPQRLGDRAAGRRPGVSRSSSAIGQHCVAQRGRQRGDEALRRSARTASSSTSTAALAARLRQAARCARSRRAGYRRDDSSSRGFTACSRPARRSGNTSARRCRR